MGQCVLRDCGFELANGSDKKLSDNSMEEVDSTDESILTYPIESQK